MSQTARIWVLMLATPLVATVGALPGFLLGAAGGAAGASTGSATLGGGLGLLGLALAIAGALAAQFYFIRAVAY